MPAYQISIANVYTYKIQAKTREEAESKAYDLWFEEDLDKNVWPQILSVKQASAASKAKKPARRLRSWYFISYLPSRTPRCSGPTPISRRRGHTS